MAGQVHFYVNRMHAIGGVTTWSFQAASFLQSWYDARVLAFNQTEYAPPDDHLFPGPAVQVWPRSVEHQAGAVTSSAGVKQRKEVKPKRPTLPTKPTKAAKLMRPSKNCLVSEGRLHDSAEQAIQQAALFIPNYIDFAYQLAALSRLRGSPSWCIGICHCDQDHYYQLLRHYEPIIHSFITVSRRCTARLLQYLPQRGGDVHFVPYGVRLPPCCPRTAELDPVARSVGPIRLLYAGRLVNHHKRVFDLIAIVKELQSRRVNFALDIVGVGPDRDQLVAGLAGQPRVHVRNGVSQPEMERVYRDYDVYLLPSETEGTSIALLESMAHGLVPIATRVSGSEDVIVDGRNGFLCAVGDVHSMVDRIATLAASAALQSRLSLQAQETIARQYRSEAQLEAFAKCVQETMNKPLIAPERARTVLEDERQHSP
jgi:glycosyltransferase involved in cell wall biosynthesis